MIQKLLVPLDGSSNASVALDVATEIAEKYGASIKMLHVGLRQPGPLTELYEAAERSFEQAEASGDWTSDHKNWPRRLQVLDHMGHMVLKDAQARAIDRGVTSVQTQIDWGEAGERILHHSKHPPVDMIVMGSRGASQLEGLFLGSVSHKVFYLAPCTCVTVHAAEGQAGLGKLERIVVPFDGSDHATKAVKLASTMAFKSGAELKLVHVLQHGQSPEHFLGAVDIDTLDADTRRALDHVKTAADRAMETAFALPEIPEAALRDLGEQILVRAKNIATDEGCSKVEMQVLAGDPAQCILNALEQDAADMVIMGMRGLGEVTGMLVGSVSYKVNHLAPCTCVAVR